MDPAVDEVRDAALLRAQEISDTGTVTVLTGHFPARRRARFYRNYPASPLHCQDGRAVMICTLHVRKRRLVKQPGTPSQIGLTPQFSRKATSNVHHLPTSYSVGPSRIAGAICAAVWDGHAFSI